MKKALWLGVILSFCSLQSFAFVSVAEAKATAPKGEVKIEIDEETGEEVVIVPTTIALPEFSADIREFQGPEFFVENGTEDVLKFSGVIKPGIYFDFGLNIKVGYNQASAKKGLAYEEDLLITPRPNGKFEVEVPFAPLLDLSRVFVVAEIYYQDQLLTRQLFKTDKLPKRPPTKPKTAEEVSEIEDEKTEVSEEQPKETGTEVELEQEQKEVEPEVEEIEKPVAIGPSPVEKLFKPQTGNKVVDHWPIFSALGLVIILILVGAIRKGLKKRHLNILLLSIGVCSYWVAQSQYYADSGGVWILPQPLGVQYYKENGVMPFHFQGTYLGEVFTRDSVRRVTLRLNKNTDTVDNPSGDTNFDLTFTNPVDIDDDTRRYFDGSDSIDVTFDPANQAFFFDYPLSIPASKGSFEDGIWNLEFKLNFYSTVEGRYRTIELPYQVGSIGSGVRQFLALDSLPPTFSMDFFHDNLAGDDVYTTGIADISNPDPLIPVPTKHPIKIVLTCEDTSNFDPAGPGNSELPFSSFEHSGCLEDDGTSAGSSSITREIYIKGNFCDDPLKCDTIGYRKFFACDEASNCNETEIFIDWYDPIPPKFNQPFGLEPLNNRVTYDENSELPTGIRFQRAHPTDDAQSIKMSGLESPQATIAAGDNMKFEFFVDDEDYFIDANGLCYGMNCPAGFDPIADASIDNLYDTDACGFEADGTRLENLYIDEVSGVCDEIFRSCVNDQGFSGELNENPAGRECIPDCPAGYTLNGTQCDP